MTRIALALGLALILSACAQHTDTMGFADTPTAQPSYAAAADLAPTTILQGMSF